LLREKIVASVTNNLVIVCDSRKPVEVLGAFPLPVEVIPFGWQTTCERIRTLGGRVTLRGDSLDHLFMTADGNYILDCEFGEIPNPVELADRLRRIVGVVETGLFVGLARYVVVGEGNSTRIVSASPGMTGMV
jgi:ribose 5-phosphate isomerase A